MCNALEKPKGPKAVVCLLNTGSYFVQEALLFARFCWFCGPVPCNAMTPCRFIFHKLVENAFGRTGLTGEQSFLGCFFQKFAKLLS